MFKRLFKKLAPSIRKDLMTDSGMLCIWDYQSFSHIHDYASWESELCEDEDILKHISRGKFVPLNLRSDGVFAVEIRFASPDLMSDREKEYLLVPSKPYKLITSGKVCVAGIEYVGANDESKCITTNIASGEYAVFVNLIDWNQEPGAIDDSGNPTANALPDMIVFITKPTPDIEFSGEIETFRKEDALR